MKMAELGLTSMDLMFETINRVEESIKQLALKDVATYESTNKNNNNHSNSHTQKPSSNHSKNKHISKNNEFCDFHKTSTHSNADCASQKKYAQNKHKYCSHHDTNGHSTEECRSPQSNSSTPSNNNGSKSNFNKHSNGNKKTSFYNNNNNDNNDRLNQITDVGNSQGILAIREPTDPAECPILGISVNGKTGKALFDSGATKSFIQLDFSNQIKSVIENIPSFQVSLANGQTETISKKTNVIFSIENDKVNTYTFNFYILSSTEFNIILGADFLRNHEAELSFKDSTISLSGHFYELHFTLSPIQKLDRTLMEKTRIFSVKAIDSSSKEQADDLVKWHKVNNPQLGLVPSIEHSIVLTNKTPITAKPYQIPAAKRAATQELIQKLLNENVIRRSNRNYSSPAFPIYKKNGQIRLVQNFKRLNEYTEKQSFPMPNIQSLLVRLRGATIFTQIDLNSAFYQIKMSEESIHLTSFVLGEDQFEFLRMPFGLTNAPRTFARAMVNLFIDCQEFLLTYGDDIIIFSKTGDSHLSYLKSFFEISSSNNLSINFEKSNFWMSQVNYLENIVTKQGVKPDTSRMNGFVDFVPNNKKDIQKVLGFVNWFRNFIPRMSDKTIFLSRKTQKSITFTWSEQDKVSLTDLLNEIKTETLLTFPDLNKDLNFMSTPVTTE